MSCPSFIKVIFTHPGNFKLQKVQVLLYFAIFCSLLSFVLLYYGDNFSTQIWFFAFTLIVVKKEASMYSFKIKSENGKVVEGLAGKLEDLEEIIAKKIEFEKLKGEVEIYSGKKLVKEYKI